MIKGVNFGNWLVLERWMSPENFQGFDAEDETWLNRVGDPEKLRELYHRHRENYITKTDFQNVADHGLNLVRLPVPYFLFGDRPEGPGCIEYVDRAMDWAEAAGIQILLDLHTAPGCQNGYDNGGILGVCKWCKLPQEVEFVHTVLERLAERYAHRQGLFGIEVLNEPISPLVYISSPTTYMARDKQEAKGSSYVPMRFLKQFYRDAYRRLRAILPEEKTIVFHDGFRLGSWGSFFQKNGMKNVMLDNHTYIAALEMNLPLHWFWVYRLFVGYHGWKLRRAMRYTPVVVGEWNICNLRALKKARKSQDPERTAREEYARVEAMERRFWEQSAGWIYWNYQLHRDRTLPPLFEKDTHMDGWDICRAWKRGWFSGKD